MQRNLKEPLAAVYPAEDTAEMPTPVSFLEVIHMNYREQRH